MAQEQRQSRLARTRSGAYGGLAQLRHINAVGLKHYLSHRPHQGVGIDNDVLDENFEPQTTGPVRCRSELGGLIKSYYREAA